MHPVSSHYVGDYALFDMTYDYDRADSALLGALVNDPQVSSSLATPRVWVLDLVVPARAFSRATRLLWHRAV